MRLFAPETPIGKERPRASIKWVGGKPVPHIYTPKTTAAYELALQWRARAACKAPMTGPLKVRIVAFFKVPASWSGAKKARTVGTFHTSKPDKDNIEKAIYDAFNGIVWADDSQVADGRLVKRWADQDGLYIEVTQL